MSVVEVHGIAVNFDCACSVLAVRYFNAAKITHVGKLVVPGPLCVIVDPDPAAAGALLPTLLAWRSPTESLLITQDPAMTEAVEAQWRGSELGCCVVQSDGICVMRLQGERCAELLQRLGAPTCVPRLGESRTSRIGDQLVTALSVREYEVLLAVERVYADHLQAWIESTLADF